MFGLFNDKPTVELWSYRAPASQISSVQECRSLHRHHMKSNSMQLQLVLPWFILRDSRSGLQVERNPLGYSHLPSDNLAEDALNRNFFRDRAQMVSH
jgi:hypothetical protein